MKKVHIDFTKDTWPLKMGEFILRVITLTFFLLLIQSKLYEKAKEGREVLRERIRTYQKG